MASTKPPKKILADVADVAGVSIASVSRFLNQPEIVSQPMRTRIEAAIKQVEFKPPKHMAERGSLPGGNPLAILITEAHNMYLHELVGAAQSEVLQANHGQAMPVIINTTHDAGRQRDILRMLVQQKPRGVIACGTDLGAQEWIEFYEQARVPLVVEGIRVQHPNVFCVMVDFQQAARRITQHLIDLGHTRIGYLAGPRSSEHSIERQAGIARALHERGLALHPELCPDVPNTHEGAFQGAAQLLQLPDDERPTAIIVYNDMLTLGALHAAQTHRKRVPEDVSIVGFDDILIAAHTHPALTTVAIPKQRIGQLAAQWLLRTWAQPDLPPQGGLTLLESPLVLRESTGPVSSGPVSG